LLSPVASLGPFDLVASNPPYVDASEIEALAPEVRDHEPRLALVPPGDAYAVYRRLAPAARPTLRPGGLLLLEIGKGMADGVSALCVGSGLLVEAVIPDLQGISRTLVARA
jgi:release factor glutamine methyltransferase